MSEHRRGEKIPKIVDRRNGVSGEVTLLSMISCCYACFKFLKVAGKLTCALNASDEILNVYPFMDRVRNQSSLS